MGFFVQCAPFPPFFASAAFFFSRRGGDGIGIGRGGGLKKMPHFQKLAFFSSDFFLSPPFFHFCFICVSFFLSFPPQFKRPFPTSPPPPKKKLGQGCFRVPFFKEIKQGNEIFSSGNPCIPALRFLFSSTQQCLILRSQSL